MGGAENSVLRMMHRLADHGWEVELVLSTGGGLLEPRVDSRVKVTRLRDKVVGQRFLSETRIGPKILWMLMDGLPFLYSRVQWLVRALKFRFKRFDVAVISLHGLSPVFCCSFVQADKRLQWIRNDLANCDPKGTVTRTIKRYKNQIDCFVCVSNTAMQSLIDLFPDLKKKSIVMYNIIDAKEMLARADKEGNPYAEYKNTLKVVTVCRLSDQSKGLIRMLQVHRELRDRGINFHWFVVGDGSDRDQIAQAVSKMGMTDRFILVGRKENPFPYYRYADISATLSYYEGLCGTVNEAKVLGKPVIATRFSGIDEQITDGMNGLIVENDKDAILVGLQRLLTDKKLREKLTNDIYPTAITDDESKLRLFNQITEEKDTV